MNGTFNDDNGVSGSPHQAEIEWGDGSNPDVATVSGSNNPFSYSFHGAHTYAQNGAYEVFVRVTNDQGQQASSDSIIVTVLNVAPTVDTFMVSPTTTDEGTDTNFNVSGTFSDPGDVADQPYNVLVDWGDGNTDTATVSGNNSPFTYSFIGDHRYDQDGSYFVTVSVTDQDGATGSSNSTIISVNNVAPAVDAPKVSPATTTEGTDTSFSVGGTFSDPGGVFDQPYNVVVDWGDGSTDIASAFGSGNPFTYAFSGSHTYLQDGSYAVTVSVTDQNGSTGTSSSTMVSVTNVTPVVDTPKVSPPTAEGMPTFFSVSGTFNDPGGVSDEPYNAVIDWGDGASDKAIVSGGGDPFTYSFNGDHTYAQSGSYSVTVSVTDQNGSTGTSNPATVTVANVAPTVGTPDVSPAKTTEGTSTGFSISGTFSDPAGALDQPYTATVDWGDNTSTDKAIVDVNTFTYSFNGSHTYTKSGTYNVTVSITDQDGDTGISKGSSVLVTHAAPIVTNTNDSGPGSLRQALADAADSDAITFNFGPSTMKPAAKPDLMTFSIVLTSGELVVNNSVTIMGLGANVLQVTRDSSAPEFRIFNVTPGHVVTIEDLSITNGVGPSPFVAPQADRVTHMLTRPEGPNGPQLIGGGGIYNDHSDLTVTRCGLYFNTSFVGGGMFNNGDTTGGGVLKVNNCTLGGNLAAFGGGIFNNGANGGAATATINNCTFSGNAAEGSAAGIYSYFGSIVVANTTFSNNDGSTCVANDQGTADIGNTILNANVSGVTIATNPPGVTTSHGYNISSDAADGSLTAVGDQINTDPMLGPVQDNGGPTPTHVPLIGSPAIDQGNRAAILALLTKIDQRGLTRPVNDPAVANAVGGDGSDIGAVELQEFVHPTSADSRKTHGAAGDFDVPLGLENFATSPLGFECRSGGASGDYQIIMNFAGNVTFSDAEVTSGAGTIGAASGSGTNKITVNLTNITDVQTITLALFDVDDGTNIADVGVRVRFRIGDVTHNDVVNSSDVSMVKSELGQPVDGMNFRSDVTANGAITSSDVTLTKSKQ